MTLETRYVLPEDAVLFPLEELAAGIRKRLSAPGSSFALTRPGSRSTTKVIDARAARLLEEFRSPATFVQAVIAVAEATGGEPRALLASAYPMLARLRGAGFLVEAAGDRDAAIRASFSSGDAAGPFEVTRCVQVLEDVEVYQARNAVGEPVCLKVARDAAISLEAEADVLRALEGGPAPTLVARGEHDGRDYVAMEWCPGRPVTAVADVLRDPWMDDSPAQLRRLCAGVARAYAALHGAGFLHVDVHPRNVLASGPGDVKLIDFGLAVRTGDGTGRARGGIGFFFEPEYARAVLAKEVPPTPSERGEQHAVAALLYLLVTGHHHVDFALERDEALGQIADLPPAPFAARGREWPALEDVLRRALAKDPAKRFDTVSDLAGAVEAAALPPRTPRAASRGTPEGALRQHMQRFEGAASLARGVGYEPTASVNYGAAGVAYAFYQLALLWDDAHYLALADTWAERAAASIGTGGAFTSADLDLGPADVDEVSLYHGPPGVHCVRALIAIARSDWGATKAAVREFVAASRGASDHVDVTTGRAGALVGAALLVDALGEDAAALPELRRLGDEVSQTVSAILRDGREGVEFLGAAHGWAGLAYAALAWARALGGDVPTSVGPRLDDLAAQARWDGDVISWPVTVAQRDDPSSYWAGWCHGTAGYVALWTLAARVAESDDFATLASAAGRHSATTLGRDSASLCCGTAGQAFALLDLYALTGDDEWLGAARRAADAAWRTIGSGRPYAASLYKGELGPILASAAAGAPGEARMPLFGIS